MISTSPRTALIAGLLLFEPAFLLTSSAATFTRKRVQRTMDFCAYRARCVWSDIHGEAGLSALPEELLMEIVKLLEWADILRIRQTSKRMNVTSKSLSVWRSVVEGVPPRLLWLERPIKTYSSQELERLFLRRQRAVAGYEALTNGATPRWRTIKVKDPPERKTMDVVPGGRWLLVPNARGSILYYDLDAHDSPAHVLIPKKPANCLTKMSIDVDSTSSYLKFNLALVFYFLRQPDYRIEVWQVDLVLDEQGQGIGLRADRQASFKQEPPGLCDALSLLGDNLAFTVFYKAHLAVYTVLVDWRSAKGSHYSKRILYPSSRHSACLLPGNVLMSATSNSIMLVPCSSVPVITDMPNSAQDIPEANRCFVTLRSIDDMSLSRPFLDGRSIRFVVGAYQTVYGITLTPTPTDGVHGYRVDTVELLKLSEIPYHIPTSLSEEFFVVWSKDHGLILQRISWSNPGEGCFPIVQSDRAVPLEWQPECCHRLEMASGRVLVDQLRLKRIMVLDLSL